MLFCCLNLPQQINRYSAVKSKLDNLDVWVFCYKKGLKMIKKKKNMLAINPIKYTSGVGFTSQIW